jgi:hypothetical protein
MRPTPAAQPNNTANKRRHDDPRSLGAGAAVADAVGRRGDTVEESTETFIRLFVVRVRSRWLACPYKGRNGKAAQRVRFGQAV